MSENVLGQLFGLRNAFGNFFSRNRQQKSPTQQQLLETGSRLSFPDSQPTMSQTNSAASISSNPSTPTNEQQPQQQQQQQQPPPVTPPSSNSANKKPPKLKPAPIKITNLNQNDKKVCVFGILFRIKNP